MDVYGTKIALIVSSMDLDMPPYPLAHQVRVLLQGEEFCGRSHGVPHHCLFWMNEPGFPACPALA